MYLGSLVIQDAGSFNRFNRKSKDNIYRHFGPAVSRLSLYRLDRVRSADFDFLEHYSVDLDFLEAHLHFTLSPNKYSTCPMSLISQNLQSNRVSDIDYDS